MDFDLMLRVYPFFIEAAWITLQLSVLTTLLGLACGTLGAMARLSRLRIFRMIGAVYVSVFRGTPGADPAFHPLFWRPADRHPA